jgi:DNA adenine methylase
MIVDINNRTKPIIKWAGGKSGMLAQLQEYFPANCNRYIEPFIGGGAVFFALQKELNAIINDSNEEIVNLYKVVRDSPNELMQSLDNLAVNYSEEFYYELRRTESKNATQRAARTIFLNKTGFNGLYRQNSKGGFNVPFGKRLKCPELYEMNNLLEASKRLQEADLRRQDFEEILNEASEGDLVYCDPPYEPLNTTSSFNAYQANGFSQAEQVRLKVACVRAAERGAMVFISNSTADFILDLYKDLDVKILSAKRAINSNGRRRGEIGEVLISA